MAYISPNTQVFLCRGVPLDASYNHTLYFTSASNQYDTISAYVKFLNGTPMVLNYQSYQRASKNSIRVSYCADDLYDCNYMIFENKAFGNKKFYAFIDGVDYINNTTSLIRYTIDVMQTWYFDYNLGECFIEREHVSDDTMGNNTVEENISIGELTVHNDTTYYYPRDPSKPLYTVIIGYFAQENHKYFTSYTTNSAGYITSYNDMETNVNIPELMYNGVYSGLVFIGVPLRVDVHQNYEDKIGANNVWAVINHIIGEDVNSTVSCMFQVPTDLWLDYVNNGSTPITHTKSISEEYKFYNPNRTEYYIPKNMKLYTYPYKQLVVTNNAGNSATYRWEQWTISSDGYGFAHFGIEGVPFITGEVLAYPTDYRGITDDYESGLVLTDFPLCVWSEDSFALWWSQNHEAFTNSILGAGITTALALVGTGVSAVMTGGLTAPAVVGAVGAVSGGISSVLSTMGTRSVAKNTPDQMRGQMTLNSLRNTQNRIGYHFYDMGIDMSVAKSIDSFFDMYGYAIREVKVPNIKDSNAVLRPHWNYVKTGGCIVKPKTSTGMPADDIKMISDIYNNGITFWSNIAEVGDYSLDNRII